MRARYWLLGVLSALALATPAAAQSPSAPPVETSAKQPVSVEQAFYLVRSTLLTLNDANRSGNYTVLHDLAAPSLQAKHTAADLSQSFLDLRTRRIDLYAVALLAPQLSTAPHIEKDGRLRLTGEFPTKPLLIRFDMLFENVDRQWRLFALSVSTPSATPSEPAAAAPDSKQKKKPLPTKH
jgi:hypothetical protein